MMALNRFGIGIVAALAMLASAATAQTAICYNCPPEWADWAAELKLLKEKTGITMPPDNKNSGQALAQLIAEKGNPVADVVYYGVTFGIQAKKDGVIRGHALRRDGTIRDTVMYSMRAGEWPEAKAQLLYLLDKPRQA